jgi:chemotaxis protein MotB
MKTLLIAGAATALGLTAGTAAAQETTTFVNQPVSAPQNALELSIGTGYTQGFGRISGGTGNSIDDVAGPGIGVQGGVGYRIDPHWMVGIDGEYQQFVTGTKAYGVPDAMDSNAAARGMMAGLELAYHLSPYSRIDPWIQAGPGYRLLYEVHATPGPTVLSHGFDWLRVTVGTDVRISPDVAVAPVLGADMNTFLWRDGGPGGAVAIGDTRLNTFVFAGLQGRVDVTGRRISHYDVAAAREQAQIAAAARERARAEALQRRLSHAQRGMANLQAENDDWRMDIAQMHEQRAAAEARAALYEDIARKLQRMVDAGSLKISLRDGRMILEVPNDIVFDSGSADLKPAGRAALEQIAGTLRGVQGHFQVAGHTDNVPIATGYPSNWELSTARALGVLHFLVADGMEPTTLSASGYGEYDPVASNASPEGRAHNRRTEIVVQPNIDAIIHVPDIAH